MSVSTAQIDPEQELETPPADLSSRTPEGQIKCVVVTPEQTVVEEIIEFVAVPLYDGELGIARGHTPLIGRLGAGELRTRTPTITRRYFIEGGFVQVRDDVVTILTNRAIAADRINLNAAADELERAKAQRATTDFDLDDKQRAIARARAQLRIAQRWALG